MRLGVVQHGQLNVLAPAVRERGDAAGLRVLAAGVVEKAVVGHVGQAQVRTLQGHRHTQQHAEERGRRAEGWHHCWRRVSGSMLMCGDVRRVFRYIYLSL